MISTPAFGPGGDIGTLDDHYLVDLQWAKP
jgi:hypothetical protein